MKSYAAAYQRSFQDEVKTLRSKIESLESMLTSQTESKTTTELVNGLEMIKAQITLVGNDYDDISK